jgi:hypothetical protein
MWHLEAKKLDTTITINFHGCGCVKHVVTALSAAVWCSYPTRETLEDNKVYR